MRVLWAFRLHRNCYFDHRKFPTVGLLFILLSANNTICLHWYNRRSRVSSLSLSTGLGNDRTLRVLWDFAIFEKKIEKIKQLKNWKFRFFWKSQHLRVPLKHVFKRHMHVYKFVESFCLAKISPPPWNSVSCIWIMWYCSLCSFKFLSWSWIFVLKGICS